MEQTALIIVDVQNDFLPPDGSLAVPGGREVIPAIKSLLDDEGVWDWRAVVATQDYHPKEHISFASSHSDKKPFDTVRVTDGWRRRMDLTLWPDHCVQGTRGAEIDADLRESFEAWKSKGKIKIVRKGWDKTVENYSAFEGYLTEATDPSEPPSPPQTIQQVSAADADITLYLKSLGIRQVVVVGLANDFCVNYTALSAIDAGFQTAVATPYMRGIDASSVDRALGEIKRRGGVVLDSEQAVKSWVS